MMTYSYDARRRMTSACDANNQVIKYEYDDFDRLAFVRDGDNELMKANIYHYKQ